MSTITIVTPTMKRPLPVLRRCIASVDQQSFGSWRHIICSDGGREAQVEEFVRQGGESRRRYMFIDEEQPLGHFGAAVRAVVTPRVKTKYIAYLDDDNFLFPNFCERMVQALENDGEAGFAICRIVHCGPLVARHGPAPAILTGIPPVTNNIDTLQVVIRTKAIQETKWVLRGYRSDGATFERLSRRFPWVAVDDVLGVHT